MELKTYKTLQGLLEEFCTVDCLTGDEFINSKLSGKSFSMSEENVENFVLLITHTRFLQGVKTNIVSSCKMKDYHDSQIVMLVFVLIFVEFPEDNMELFKNIRDPFKRDVLQYFTKEENIIATALLGCGLYEDQYVLDHIIHPILNKTKAIQQLEEYFKVEEEKQINKYKKPPTVPCHLGVLQRRKQLPAAPLNTPIGSRVEFHARKIPKSVYLGDNIEQKLMGEFEKNKRRAEKLLNEAKTLSNRNFCKDLKPKIVKESKVPQFRANKVPEVRNNVEIKRNLAAVLREANLCAKEQENEIKNLEAILKGGATLDNFHHIEEQSRKLEWEKVVELTERRHLEGLLTFEEAILAKQRLLECNKSQFKKFMEERETILRLIEQWKKREEEKIAALVKKAQDIGRNAKESERKLKEDRKNCADRVKEESKQLLQQSYEKQQREFVKKVKLIEEIKTLHQLKTLDNAAREFDPTECPNFGLLCEMSIAELQENLAVMKINMKKQLERKRRCIVACKEKQRQMVENLKDFVAQARISKQAKGVPRESGRFEQQVQQSPELDRLREQLEHVRELRRKAVP